MNEQAQLLINQIYEDLLELKQYPLELSHEEYVNSIKVKDIIELFEEKYNPTEQ